MGLSTEQPLSCCCCWLKRWPADPNSQSGGVVNQAACCRLTVLMRWHGDALLLAMIADISSLRTTLPYPGSQLSMVSLHQAVPGWRGESRLPGAREVIIAQCGLILPFLFLYQKRQNSTQIFPLPPRLPILFLHLASLTAS